MSVDPASVLLFPAYRAKPENLQGHRDCVTLCVFYESYTLNNRAELQQAHDDLAMRPQVMFVVVNDPLKNRGHAWQKLNRDVTFRSLVVVEFVDPRGFEQLSDADVTAHLSKFIALKQSAHTLDAALLQKECLWAEENALDHLTTSRDLINTELQHPLVGAKVFVAGHAFAPSAAGHGSADVKMAVYLDTQTAPDLDIPASSLLKPVAAHSHLQLVESRALADFVVILVDDSFDSGRVVSSETDFYVVLLPANSLSTLGVWQMRDALDQKGASYDIVHLPVSSSESYFLAAIDCGFRNAKQSLLTTRTSRLRTQLPTEQITQEVIDKQIGDALRAIRAIKRS